MGVLKHKIEYVIVIKYNIDLYLLIGDNIYDMNDKA